MIDQQSMDLLRQREGLEVYAYRDTKGIWTIGVGHTGPEVVEGLMWPVSKCLEVFAADLVKYEKAVDDCVKVPLQPHQRGALVSFTYNCGVLALPHSGVLGGPPSSILRALNAGDYSGAGMAFNNWMADPEDRTRRAGEREQFLGRHFVARFPA